MSKIKKNTHSMIIRWLLYIGGLVILALGISLNTRTCLGVSPIISVAYSVADIFSLNFGNVTFALYGFFVLIEVIIHSVRRETGRIPKDLAQVILSLIFTRFLNLFNAVIPVMGEQPEGSPLNLMAVRILFLILAVVLTGIGAALSLNMRLIPNPGDGIVQTISDCAGKGTGFVKNCVDITCVVFSVIIGLVLKGKLVGIGIGTIIAMIGVGRVIAVFNHFTLKRQIQLIEESIIRSDI